MGNRPEPKLLQLDFDDLVKELDQFEQDAVRLQERIARLMADARQAVAVAVQKDAGIGQGPEEEGEEA